MSFLEDALDSEEEPKPTPKPKPKPEKKVKSKPKPQSKTTKELKDITSRGRAVKIKYPATAEDIEKKLIGSDSPSAKAIKQSIHFQMGEHAFSNNSRYYKVFANTIYFILENFSVEKKL